MAAIEDARKAAEAEFGTVRAGAPTFRARPVRRAAEETTRLATDDRVRPEGLAPSGSAGPEIGVSRPRFKPYSTGRSPPGCTRCRTPARPRPQTVWDALTDLRAERIGHGTSSAQDPKLLAHLAERRIPLEVCPTSNIATRAVRTLDEHPIKEFTRAGVPGDHQLRRPADVRHRPQQRVRRRRPAPRPRRRGLADLAKNAVEASFLDGPGKARISDEIDTYTSAWLAS
ncbi:hypothetical protein LV779_17520 [Streptomyces thinghirensis]|nr:hypothetical protein [Streptomyces thinghirensis]